MSEETVPGEIIERFHASLRAAGIPADATDIAAVIDRGYLRRVLAFEQLSARMPVDPVPAYLAVPESASRGRGAGTPQEVHGHGADVPLHPPAGLPGSQDQDFRSLAEVADLLRRRVVSPVELTRRSLAAIERHDTRLNAFQLVLGDRALASAQRAEAEIQAGHYRGPLHGVPVAVKDLLAMVGTATTAGSRILANWQTAYDAAAVERLDAAGAIIVGKTRMSEYAYSPGSNNAHYGPTRNPWALAYDTGGSSSGSGAAVAAGLVFAALGTDTGGSIRIPASQCGIVGLKPSYGHVSLYGAVSLSWSLDHLGPMTRTVQDAALLLDVLAGYDPRDPRTRIDDRAMAGEHGLDGGVRGLRVGVLGDDGTGQPLATPETLAAWAAALAALEEQGATLVPIDLPQLEDLRTISGAILVLEALAFHERGLRERFTDYGEFMRRRVLHGAAFGPAAFVRAQQLRALVQGQISAAVERVDLLCTPTMPDGAPPLGTPATTQFTGPFNALGWPAISVPMGRTSTGLPLGMQLIGRPWDEPTVLRAARVVEAYVPWQTSL